MINPKYNIQQYSYGARHNSQNISSEHISYAWINPISYLHGMYSNDNLDYLEQQLQKIAPSVYWDHNFSLGTILVFKRKDEDKLEQLENKSNELGYRLTFHI